MSNILVFITEDGNGPGRHDVQWQFPGSFTLNCVAFDLSFAEKIFAFVAETRGNSEYRDPRLADGSYRTIPEKSIDLSPLFMDVQFKMRKGGKYDDDYYINISAGSQFSVSFELKEPELDWFLDALRNPN